MKIKPFDIIAIIILITATLLVNNALKGSGEKELILTIDGKSENIPFENKRINLHEKTGHNITIEISKDKKARVLESDCPNKICVKSGWIGDCGESAVCVPNKVAISILCTERDIDAESK